MCHRSFSIRLARFFLLVLFIAHTLLASAGAHYETGLPHLEDGTNQERESSGLHFSEFDNDDANQALGIAELEDELTEGNEHSVCLSRHIHILNICMGEKPVNHSPYTVAVNIELDDIKREAFSKETASHNYLPPALRLASSRSPPLL